MMKKLLCFCIILATILTIGMCFMFCEREGRQTAGDTERAQETGSPVAVTRSAVTQQTAPSQPIEAGKGNGGTEKAIREGI